VGTKHWGSRVSKWGTRRRSREDGGVGAEGVRCGEGCPFAIVGGVWEGSTPLHRKNCRFKCRSHCQNNVGNAVPRRSHSTSHSTFELAASHIDLLSNTSLMFVSVGY